MKCDRHANNESIKDNSKKNAIVCRVFGVIDGMQISFDAKAVLSRLPMDQPLKTFVKEMGHKTRQFCLYWQVRKRYSCILVLNPGISTGQRNKHI